MNNRALFIASARQFVQIELNDGGTLRAATYVVKTEILDQLEQSGWDFDYFLLNGKATFQQHYRDSRSL